MKQIITIGYLNKTLWGGHIQPREQDFVISEEGISMSLPASYNLHCFKIMEIVKYEQADKDRQPVRREQRDRLRRKHLGYRGDLTCPDNNGGGQPRTDNSGDSALRGEFTWKGKHLDPWSGFQWNTSPAFSIPSLKDLSKTLRCDDTMCVMEIVRYERAEADNSRKL